MHAYFLLPGDPKVPIIYEVDRIRDGKSFATRRVVRTWSIPGSPDMGGVSADGRVLWLSGRYDDRVYAIDAGSGRLLASIMVPAGPHGLCVWPQPGRHSLGHTGVMR